MLVNVNNLQLIAKAEADIAKKAVSASNTHAM